jgi:hypothetical protein
MSSVPPADRPAPVRLAKGQEVSLGCGTLILIGLIVLLVSHSGSDDTKLGMNALQSEVAALRRAVEAQTEQIKALQEKLDAKAKEKE